MASLVYETPALLLQTRDLPGMDRLGIFYTREYGLITILLKGVKKPQSKLQYRLRERALVEIEFVLGKTFPRLTSIRDVDSFRDFLLSSNQLALQSLIVEILLHMLEEGSPDQELFDSVLVSLALTRDIGDRAPRFVISWMLVRWMALFGFGLETTQCVLTNKTKSVQFGMSVRSGGLVSKESSAGIDDWTEMSPQEIKRIRQWQRGEVDRGKVPWRFIEYYLQWYGIPIKSLGLLRIYSDKI